MSHSARFAISLVILWIGFACLFVAFHPGGVQINGRPAQNPSDITKFAVQKLSAPRETGLSA
jgi:hypothetical protein